MELITIINNNCTNCDNIKRLCPFKDYKGKRNPYGLSTIYIEDEGKLNGCTLYTVIMK